MKKTEKIYSVLCCALLVLFGVTAKAQMTITPITNQDVKQILETYFLGEGVKIDTTRPIYFNGQTTINNNQIGTFTNTDTSYSGKNIPIKSGLILATDACKNIAGGYESRQNAIHGADTYAPALYMAYKNYVNSDLNKYGNSMSGGSPNKFNDIAVLDFWVIPQACEMSFKYCFGSEEYPNYVCTGFNDFFGLFCDGPYDANLDPYTEDGIFYPNPTNIAVIPGTYEEDEFTEGLPVMINTCNNKNSNNSCGGDNNEYFIDNRTKTCKTTTLGGYTRRLTTAMVKTVPGMKYHIQIAICNIDDQALQSAVFLEAGSFSAKKIDVESAYTMTLKKYTENDPVAGYRVKQTTNGDTLFTAFQGCVADTMILHANYIADEEESEYQFFLIPSDDCDLLRGKDYDFFLVNKDGSVDSLPASNTVKMPAGDSIIKYVLKYYPNGERQCGETCSLMFISTDCNGDPRHTVYFMLEEPCQLDLNVEGGITVCHDMLPIKDTVKIKIGNVVSFANVNVTRGGNIIWQDTVKNTFFTKDTTFYIEVPVLISSVGDTNGVTVKVTDQCDREIDTTVYYKVLTSETKATADKIYICDGDSVVLSCPDAATYTWTSLPVDTSLVLNDNSKLQNPTVKPNISTTYTIVTVSEEGCIASDSIKISVEPIIKAEMELNPKKVYYSNPEIQYKDLSDDAFAREWYFGDGTTSSYATGYHTYKTDTSEDSHLYEVMLIVYNKAMCPDTIIDSVLVETDFTFWTPNAFMPGYSESSVAYFGPKGALLKDWELFIYNRWGAKIFEGKEKMWDGKLENGQIAPQGTYIYYITYKDGHGIPQRKSGTFAVLPADGNK